MEYNDINDLIKAAQSNDKNAQKELGHFYATNFFHDENIEKLYWIIKAANLGDNESQMFLKDYSINFSHETLKEAIKYYKIKAMTGDIDAQCAMGFICAYNLSFPSHLSNAVEWWEKSGKAGNSCACFALANLMDAQKKGQSFQ